MFAGDDDSQDEESDGYDDVDLGGGATRQGTVRDWEMGVHRQATRNFWRGMCSGLAMLCVFAMAVHVAADFYDEYDSARNRRKTELAEMWVKEICQKGAVLPPDAVSMCGDYRDWLSRSLAMNALRLSLHNHVDHVHTLGSLLTGGWLPGDSFLGFQAKQIVNATCTSLATAIPILVLVGVVYVALLLRGPVTDFRSWLGLRNHRVEPPRAQFVRLDRDTFVRGRPRDRGLRDVHAPASVGRGWFGLSESERLELAHNVMQHLRATHKNRAFENDEIHDQAYVPYVPRQPTSNHNLYDARQQFATAFQPRERATSAFPPANGKHQ